MFEGKNQKIMELLIEIDGEFKDLLDKLTETLPKEIINKLKKEKKFDIKTNKYSSSYEKFKSDGVPQSIFRYKSLDYSDNTLNSLQLTILEVDEKFLKLLPLYYESNEGLYDYNYIMSIEYNIYNKFYEYDLEIRKINEDNFYLAINVTKNNCSQDEELNKKLLTRNELLSKINNKKR